MTGVTTLTEAAAEAAITAAARVLALPTVRDQAGAVADAAARDGLTHRGFLAEVGSAEVGARAERRRIRRIHQARLVRIKRLDGFDLAAAPTINPATIAALAAGDWIDQATPVVLHASPRHRQSHLLIGLGVAACEQGRSVRYTTAAGLDRRARARPACERALSRTIARCARLDLLLVERHRPTSTIIMANREPSEWLAILADPLLAQSAIDRLQSAAWEPVIEGESYRRRPKPTLNPAPHEPRGNVDGFHSCPQCLHRSLRTGRAYAILRT